MTTRERNDAIFRAALTPAASPGLRSGLADSIHDAIVATPQVKAASRWSLGGSTGLLRTGAMGVALFVLALLLLVAAIVVLSSRPKPVLPDVLTYRGGPERTGVLPGPGPAGDPVLAWEADMNDAVAVMPVAREGTVYVADLSGTVRALDEATGEDRWTVDLQSPVNGSPALAGGLLILGTDAGDVVALSAATGNEAWRFPTGGPVRASPAIVGDLLYVGSNDGNVYALDVATSAKRWSQSLGAPVTRGVAVSDGVVYAGATGGRFRTFDAASGVRGWTNDNLGAGEVGTPMVADGLVFVTSGLLEVGPSDGVTALDVRTGDERWRFPSPDGDPVYTGAVGDGAIYISTTYGDVYRLDELTGSPLPGWPFHADGGVGYLSGLVDGVLYIPSEDRYIHAVNVETGKERWKFPVVGAPNVPIVLNGRVIVGTSLGKVIAIGGTLPPSSGRP